MEVGAVKQAFNNEVILLKKKLNQAKIQIIHKLTRKAKTLVEKKGPEQLKEKLKRKAESAINEVLTLKKITTKDLAKFCITHTGQLNDYLNKPQVDHNKACARLLLHKCLQDKYKFIRARFSDIPIEDLFMSRLERRKIKKEAKNKQRAKKKEKVVNKSGGNWDVEDLENIKGLNSRNKDDSCEDNYENKSLESEDESTNHKVLGGDSDDMHEEKYVSVNITKYSEQESLSDNDSDQESEPEVAPKQSVKIPLKHNIAELKSDASDIKSKKKNKTDRNKNLNEKIHLKKFKKESSESSHQEAKIVDPFFITTSGQNYMTLAEPRPPDKVKEVHKQGNRKLRRAAMFGHVPKIKSTVDNIAGQNDSHQNNFKHKFQENNLNNGDTKRKYPVNDNSKRNRDKSFKNITEDSKPEKLHPSWEAKKKLSNILPFQGKKIVFDES